MLLAVRGRWRHIALRLSVVMHNSMRLSVRVSVNPFSPCDCEAYARSCYRRLSVCLSICPYVCLSVCLSNACIVTKQKHLAKKSSIMTNRKRLRTIQWAYVAPVSQRGLKSKKKRFPYKNWAFLEESLLQSFTAWKLQRQICTATAFTGYLTVHKWLVDDVPFYLKFSAKVTHLLQKRRLPIDIRSYSTWTIAPSEKSSIITNRKSTTGFPMSRSWTVYAALSPKEELKNAKWLFFI